MARRRTKCLLGRPSGLAVRVEDGEDNKKTAGGDRKAVLVTLEEGRLARRSTECCFFSR